MSRLSLVGMSVMVMFAITRPSHCLIECKDPPSSSQVFVDSPKLQMMSIQHRDVIQTPHRCSLGNSTSTCDNLLCCAGEVGCCLRDSASQRQTCGCKRIGDSECAFPAPLAVLRSYVCKPEEMAQITMCLRKVRDGESNEDSISISSGTESERDTPGSAILRASTIDYDVDLVLHSVVKQVGDYLVPSRTLKQFNETQLEDNLEIEVLDKLVNSVIAKRAKGISYGRRTSQQ